MLKVNAITLTVDDTTLLENVSVAVEPGKVMAVVGPNGAGKSTTMKMLTGCLKKWR